MSPSSYLRRRQLHYFIVNVSAVECVTFPLPAAEVAVTCSCVVPVGVKDLLVAVPPFPAHAAIEPMTNSRRLASAAALPRLLRRFVSSKTSRSIKAPAIKPKPCIGRMREAGNEDGAANAL